MSVVENLSLMAKPQQRWRRTFLREWRVHRDLTQEALADAMGISEAYLSDIENGKKRYNQEMMEKAAQALDTTPADIISRPPAENEATSVDIWALWNSLDPEDRQRAAVIISTLKR